MRLVTYLSGNGPRFGALVRDQVLDLARASASYHEADLSIALLPSRIEDFMENIDGLLASVRRVVSRFEEEGPAESAVACGMDRVTFAPPIPRPPKIICVARNYAEHAKEAGLEISPIPILFARFSTTLIGSGAPIIAPAVSSQLDWEGELAIIIGKHTAGRRISKQEAMNYVFGYTIFNDVTVRDYQFRVAQYTAGKNFRASGPLGPYILTADEVADPHRLDIRTTLNGQVVQSANTSDMIYDIPTILEHIADFVDLEPGDVIATGTPAGVGFKRKPPVFLADGDHISVEITGLGSLTNPVKKESI